MKTTCIMCPMGCLLTVTESGGEIKVGGNTCKRGVDYGRSEYVRPVRSVTTLVKRVDGAVVSVKTSKAVDKSKIFDVVAAAGALILSTDVKAGDVALKNAAGTGADLIVTGLPD